MMIENKLIRIEILENTDNLWSYTLKEEGKTYFFKGPVFEIDACPVEAKLADWQLVKVPRLLSNGCMEYVIKGRYTKVPQLYLQITFRIAENNPVVRFQYVLSAEGSHRLTKVGGSDNLTYISTSFEDCDETIEVRFSEFNETVHSFCLSEMPVDPECFENHFKLMGPMLVGAQKDYAMLLAYEHGSQYPDAFLGFALSSPQRVDLKAVKGNYYAGYEINADKTYETIWMQAGAVKGDVDALAKKYREFVLKYMTVNAESRNPYIFYNTWAYQERNKHWNGKKFLDSMTEDRILAEIEIAHRMGVEVFVMDTGWYEKTGDWRVNRKRFTENLKTVKTKLDQYGMKLGLWFDPTKAAVTSNILLTNQDCESTWNDKPIAPREIWETEESKTMCLPSDYYMAFVNELIRLVKEVGVTYFKWDAISQYGCSDPKHYHGTEENSLQERKDCYAFQIGIYMAKVVEKLCEVCPEVIVDFDITEGHRFVGLGFLSVGKYFLINNGPYYRNLNIPFNGNNGWSNVFVYPGSARARICRTPLTFDKWIPSVLFLTHYLPDDPKESQNINIASLILGQNGIWGDLLNISEEGIQRFASLLSHYKEVREDVTESTMVTYGTIGNSLEVREKISEVNGRGVISIFSETAGTYSYITSRKVSAHFWASEGTDVKVLESGKCMIEVTFDSPDAKMIFFK